MLKVDKTKYYAFNLRDGMFVPSGVKDKKLIDKMTKPSRSGPRWFYRGVEVVAGRPRELLAELSGMMKKVFPKTPRIYNEMIVRKKPSPIVINARKKLLLGILARVPDA